MIYDASYSVRDGSGGYLAIGQALHVSSVESAREEIVAHEIAHARNPWWAKNVSRLIEVKSVDICEGGHGEDEQDEEGDDEE